VICLAVGAIYSVVLLVTVYIVVVVIWWDKWLGLFSLLRLVLSGFAGRVGLLLYLVFLMLYDCSFVLYGDMGISRLE